jgi:hypothetical protein
MWPKMVVDFFMKNDYPAFINLKRTQALLESNLPAIRLMP